jgi:hypothetical protein
LPTRSEPISGESQREAAAHHGLSERPEVPKYVAAVHALQDAAQVRQDSPGRFEIPDWDTEARNEIASVLSVLRATLPDWRGATGLPEELDPIRHLIVTAIGWGLNPEKEATYLNVTPALNDGTTFTGSRSPRSRRRLLVDQRVQRARLLRAQRAAPLFAQLHHGEEGGGGRW